MPPHPPRATPGPLPPVQAGLWRRTPPAIFPPILGLLATGLGWRAWFAGSAGPGAALAETVLGGLALLYLFALVAWLAKPLRRPGVVTEELRALPGLSGLAAAGMGAMLLAVVLVPYAPGLALATVSAALVAHLALALLFVRRLATEPPEGRTVNPVWHLVLVGPVLAPLSLFPLGLAGAGRVILAASVVMALGIWAVSAVQMIRRRPPAPLRPLLAIHVSPAAMFAIVGTLAGLPLLAGASAVVVAVMVLALLASARWLTEAGFTPLWGAFTFPMAASAGALIAVGGGAGVAGWAGGLVLVAATLAVPAIAFRVLRMWANGQLAQVSNAARA